jgi:TPR repeat protein
MNKYIAIILLTVSILPFGTPAFAEFSRGWWAYNNGDYANAFKEWEPLAEQGDAVSQFYLGRMYADGQGVTQDYKAAVKWYRLAADRHAPAQLHLGLMYDNGLGVIQDYKAAVKWYRLAAEQGNTHAQVNLGLMYYKEQGVNQDNIKAHMWWNIAASQGDERAAEYRDKAAKDMTPADISKAQDLARECVAKDYKGC